MPPAERPQGPSTRFRRPAAFRRTWKGLLPLLALLIAFSLLGSSLSPSSPPSLDPPEVRELIEQLDHGKYKVRQEASQKLLGRGLAVRPALLRALRKDGLSLEARLRLERIADELLGFTPLGSLQGAEEAWIRVGYDDRMFVIDNAWDLKRYRAVVPRLPEVDLRTKQLVLVMSWPSRPRTILKPTTDDDTLVLPVREDEEDESDQGRGSFRPPQFVAAQVTAWIGPIRFELNGKPTLTIWKGRRLETEAARQWQEIQRLHAGGDPSPAQRLDAERPRWGKGTTDERIDADLAGKAVDEDERKRMLVVEFRRLADMRGTPAVKEVVRFAENLREFDPAIEAAWHALSAIGSPDVVAGCAKALKSGNYSTQYVGIAVAEDLGMAELRPLYHLALTSSHAPIVRGGMNGLSRIGWHKEDVPSLIVLVKRVDAFLDCEVVRSAVFQLGELGHAAESALPALEALGKHPIGDPDLQAGRILQSLHVAAAEAIDKIRGR
jgi:hypothetical protein